MRNRCGLRTILQMNRPQICGWVAVTIRKWITEKEDPKYPEIGKEQRFIFIARSSVIARRHLLLHLKESFSFIASLCLLLHQKEQLSPPEKRSPSIYREERQKEEKLKGRRWNWEWSWGRFWEGVGWVGGSRLLKLWG